MFSLLAILFIIKLYARMNTFLKPFFSVSKRIVMFRERNIKNKQN